MGATGAMGRTPLAARWSALAAATAGSSRGTTAPLGWATRGRAPARGAMTGFTTVLAMAGAMMGAMGAMTPSAQGTGMLASLTQGADLPRRVGTARGAATGAGMALMVLTAGVATTGVCTATAGAFTMVLAPARGRAPRVVVARTINAIP